ncbi:FAD-dependent oxidoreductase [Aminobacter sp. MSH1]|uniref:NAD(P)/FAD-dependent oxidoreductase n=1 Tax=Aminobacter sp. MSH1 TaxID=374606 RepID=UPI000D364715|nr:FAD-dependent oxidoreductase [Aminobacter sp. MSH1]
MSGNVVIIGAGQAGFQVAASLRSRGFDGRIVMFGDEAHLPYMRPPLSKGYLAGESDEFDLPFRNVNFYRDKNVVVHLSSVVTHIDREKGLVIGGDGVSVEFDHLVLATGARPRPHPDLFAGAVNVRALRSLEDAARLKAAIASWRHVTVIGGGFIGLEFASAARKLGKDVLVVEAADRLMARAVSPVISARFLDLHRANGVDIRLADALTDVRCVQGKVNAVRAGASDWIETDFVLVGIGVIPNVELAEAAGLVVSGGIVVDAFLRTHDRRIFAIGDCASFSYQGSNVRIESVQNAVDQGKYVADAIIGGERPYSVIPWFWSDQFGWKLQIAGLCCGGCQQTIVESGDKSSFNICHDSDGRLRFVESVNDVRSHLAARKLLAEM